MLEWIKLAKISEIPVGNSIAVTHGKLQIALFNEGGELFAINNLCPHAAGPLVEAWVENGRVVCPWHGWSFPLDPNDPPNDGLPRYRVRIEGDDVFVELPTLEPEQAD